MWNDADNECRDVLFWNMCQEQEPLNLGPRTLDPLSRIHRSDQNTPPVFGWFWPQELTLALKQAHGKHHIKRSLEPRSALLLRGVMIL